MEDFHFIHADWLILLLLIPVLWVFYWRRRRPGNALHDLVDQQLAPFVLSGQSARSYTKAFVLGSLLIGLAALAMAGPAWEKREVPTFQSQQAVVVALDLSRSMYARDVTPSRLDLARFKLLDLLEARQEGQTGFVVFAGDAFIVSPLTRDVKTITAQVKNLGPDIMPVQGSRASQAILRSMHLLKQSGASKGSILLILDGISLPAAAEQAAEQALAEGYSVSVLAVGTAVGAPIPLSQGGFVVNERGDTVMAGVDQAQLERLTRAGGGTFVNARIGDSDIDQLVTFWEQSLENNDLLTAEAQSFDAWFNEGIWLVLLLLPMMALVFRQGWLPSMALVVSVQLLATPDLQAAWWDDLWQTPDQQGAEAFQNNQLQDAQQLFQNPDWKAAAAYREGDYKTAEKLYSSGKTLQAQYNYGNALAKQGKYEAALAAYTSVLQQNPEHEDAQYNRDLVQNRLNNQQKNRQDQQNKSSPSNESPQNNQAQQDDASQPPANNQSSQSQPSPPSSQNNQSSAAQQAQDPQQDSRSASAAEQSSPEQAETDEADHAENSDNETDTAENAQQTEQQQATRQWLRRIPDDPAGLWRRKFYYQYQQGAQPAQGDDW